jgi:fatty acid kinase fatty acid binding subunit
MKVVVVTDSSAAAPPAWTSGLPLHVVPFEIAWPDGSLDAGDMPYAAIAERLASSSAPPKTGSPSPGSYESLFAELLAQADGVLVVCPSAELSTTVGSAMLAARQLGDDRVRVLDARTAAAGQGLVSIEAARTAAAGGDLDAVGDRALAVAGRVQVWATLSQLDFLRRSGRLPAIAAIGAGALRLQPIVRYAGSSPAPVGVARSPQRATERLYRAWERSVTSGGNGALHAVAFHSARPDEAADLVHRILQRTSGEAATVEVSASLASHTGPGLLGLAWFWDN